MDDLVAITQLILSERQGRDRSRWSQMREAYLPDSAVRLSWFRGSGHDFVTASEAMSGRGDKALHRLTPPQSYVLEDRAVAEVPCTVEFQVQIHGIPAHLVSYARLNYRLERTAGTWRIRRLDAIYERDTLTPAIPGQAFTVADDDVDGLRASYRLLGYYLRLKQFEVPDDLLGDDEPADVERFYERADGWLHRRE